MNNKIRLVTVTGSRVDTLWHMLNHYKNIVDEMYVIVYEWETLNIHKQISLIVNQFSNAKIIKTEIAEKYNWEKVTDLYNEVKELHPNDWWVISDDDEFHLYSKPLKDIISDCEKNGWNIVRGGFIDRIGHNGIFPRIKPIRDIFEQFPLAGFFRYPMSGACPNKICIVKGNIEITSGQHYAKIDGHTTWRWQGWNHPQIAPIDVYNVQVHHFKWDETCVSRIKDVADIKKDYSYSDEYLKMYQSIRRNNFQIDVDNIDYQFQYCPTANYENYKNWDKLFKKIISI
jgi:hypothetical protein